ncbi:glycosyl hydrolase family 3 N terminal domain-containing protein [Apodospora peruviana]|uniref:beta-glucosidase n=1 Tax=Apodospora peruviana TaxID=516989 RepID=A0AAE0IAR6_9PEZI|nr:glycosyl hydrolase family 3 N terminal domain-containing protein [Apodospora peruviana]
MILNVLSSSFLVTVSVAALTVTAAETPLSPAAAFFPSPWADGGGEWAEAYAKARAFVANLTVTEKVNLTTGTGWEADRCIGMTGSVPRLGFRGFCLEDGPLGVRYTDHNSAFPAGINVAATFSRDLMRRRGEAMGEEFNGKGIDVQLGPVAGPLGRVPQGGRNWEGFSPDPYLTGVAMAETVRGIQSRGVIACAKHYILNEQEHYRNRMDVQIDDRTMHELYLWPFADAVRAGVGSVMCSYNKIHGDYACENGWTNNYLLKNELNFQGFVMSDWGAQHTTLGSALGGLDMAMPGDGGRPPYGALWGGALTEAVLKGEVPQWRLDDMVVRIMAAYYKVRTGNYTTRPEINFSAWTKYAVGPLYSASNQTYTVVNEFVDVQAGHGKLIREIGAKSVVLLKNENSILPLKRPASIAVIGEDAQDTPGGPNACPERNCTKGTLAMGYGSGTADYPYLISPATAVKLQAASDNTVFTNISGNWDLDAAKATASNASVAIVFVMAHAGENFITIDGNAGDRNNLTLWNGGDELIKAVASVNPNTIVVLHTVGPVIIEYAKQHPNISAILWAGLPGQETGNGLVDVLYGKVNPQGRSPFTWGKSVEDYGAKLTFQASNPLAPSQTFNEGIFIDYRYFDKAGIEPTYSFGSGLSYTSFSYLDINVLVQSPTTYTAASGLTSPAPTYGTLDRTAAANMAPAGFKRISPYVYPWLVNNSSLFAVNGTSISPTAGVNGTAQPLLPAGGAPGGNPGLYDVIYTVSAVIKNTGKLAGTEIPQLYVQLGGKDNAFGVLRGFDEVALEANEQKTVTFNLTRRDISNWNSSSQNWEITNKEKFVFIGSSALAIRLNSTLPAPPALNW